MMIQKTRLSLAVLHHMRWLAAFMVAISHIRQNLLLDYVDVKHPTLLVSVPEPLESFESFVILSFWPDSQEQPDVDERKSRQLQS